MKIIQIMPEFGLAGAETMCENLSYELMRHGEEVIVISLYDYHSVITERLEQNGIRVLYLNKTPGLDLSMIWKMVKVFKSEKPDVIHTHRYVMQYAIPAAVIARIKRRIHTVHNVAQKENTAIARKVNYLFFKFAHVIPVALSNEIQKTIEKEYRMKSYKIPVILNGIDLAKCIEKTCYEVKGQFKILHIGRFSEQKNHVSLIEAFSEFVKKYPESILTLIGDGEKKDEIQRLVEKKELTSKVKFLGMQSSVYSYLNESDVFVLSSNYEGVPMTLIEAMGTGIPIIATAVGGVPDMLENGKEALLVSTEISEISSAFERLFESYEKRKQLGINAKKRSEAFSAKHMAERYLEVYDQA